MTRYLAAFCVGVVAAAAAALHYTRADVDDEDLPALFAAEAMAKRPTSSCVACRYPEEGETLWVMPLGNNEFYCRYIRSSYHQAQR